MKYGVNTFIWRSEFQAGDVSLFPRIREGGFDGVEIPVINPGSLPSAVIRRGLEDHGLECTACSVLPGGLSLISDDASVRRRALDQLKSCVEAAAIIGARILAGPLYSPVGYLSGVRRTREEWQRLVECYRALSGFLAGHGVTIAIEPLNRFETYFLNTVADAVTLCGEIGVPEVGILFDTFHANIEEKDVAFACRAAGPHLKHVHACENDRGTPGTGHVDWPGVFASLRAAGYDGWLVIESFGFSLGELSSAAAIWRDLAPTAESIAFDGVQFLRRNVQC